MKNRYWKLFVSLDGEEFSEEFGSHDLEEVIVELREWKESETNRKLPSTFKNRIDYRIESSPAK